MLTVLFNRPEARNAMTFAMYDGLEEACARADADDSVRVMVLRGAGGRAFVAGTDISQFSTFTSGEDGIAYEERISRVVNRLEDVAVPTVAAIEGPCVGGGLALAAACDLRVATESSRFGVPIARTLGNCLSMNSYSLLVHHLGPGRTLDMLLRARLLSAADAHAAGFVGEVVPDGELEPALSALLDVLLEPRPAEHEGGRPGGRPAAAGEPARRRRPRPRGLRQRRLPGRGRGLRRARTGQLDRPLSHPARRADGPPRVRRRDARPARGPARGSPARSSGTARATSSGVIRASGPDTETAMRKSAARTGTATHRTPSSCSPSSMAKPARRMPCRARISSSGSVMVFAVCAGIPARCTSARTWSSGRRESSRLADAGAVRVHPPADLGEHPHGVVRRHLPDVHHAVPFEDGEVGGLAELRDEASSTGRPEAPEHHAGDLPEGHEARAERVPPVGQLTHVPAVDDGAHEAVDRGDRQPAGHRDLADRRLPARGRDRLEHIEDPPDGLHAAGRYGISHASGSLELFRLPDRN